MSTSSADRCVVNEELSLQEKYKLRQQGKLAPATPEKVKAPATGQVAGGYDTVTVNAEGLRVNSRGQVVSSRGGNREELTLQQKFQMRRAGLLPPLPDERADPRMRLTLDARGYLVTPQ